MFSQLPAEGSGVIQYSDKEMKACRVPGACPDHTAGYQQELGLCSLRHMPAPDLILGL